MDHDAEMLGSDDERNSTPGNQTQTQNTRSKSNKTNNNLKVQPRFSVRKWTAMALWAYDISVDNCAICRNHIMDKCIECQSVQEMTNVDENCSIAWGKCCHVFHMHCISKWLNTRQVCPLDNRQWEFKKYGD